MERAALRPSLPPALLAQLTEKSGEVATVDELDGVRQKALSVKIDANKQRQLTERLEREGEMRDQARMASLGLPDAGDWLNALPFSALGFQLLAPRARDGGPAQAGRPCVRDGRPLSHLPGVQ